MPRTIGAVISSGRASLHDLGTSLGLEDVYVILEVLAVDAHNRRILSRREA